MRLFIYVRVHFEFFFLNVIYLLHTYHAGILQFMLSPRSAIYLIFHESD